MSGIQATAIAATQGIIGTGGKFALTKGALGKGIMANLAAPLTANR